MSENKKRISKAQSIVLVSIVLAVAVVIILSLVLHEREHAPCPCCPWCFGICPWCWIILDIVIVLMYGIILFAMCKIVMAVPAAPAVVPQKHPHHFHPLLVHHKPYIKHEHKLNHAKQYDATVSLETLMGAFAPGEEVNIAILKAKGLVNVKADGYKVLVKENEKMDRPLVIHATSFSAQAKHAIIAAGGQAIKVYH